MTAGARLRGFDHAILIVRDVEDAARDFAGLGFAVATRPDRPGGHTATRFVCFAEQSYLMLMAYRDAESAAKHRLGPAAATGEGWADYSVWADAPLAEIRDGLAAEGVATKGPSGHAAPLTTGGAWSVNLLLAGWGANGPPVLPFVAEDTADRGLRVPFAAGTAQPFGATGIRGVTVVAGDLAAVRPALGALFGPGEEGAHPDAARAVRFALPGKRWVEALEPSRADSPLREHLARRGDGIFAVALATPNETARGHVFDPALTHGARLTLA